MALNHAGAPGFGERGRPDCAHRALYRQQAFEFLNAPLVFAIDDQLEVSEACQFIGNEADRYYGRPKHVLALKVPQEIRSVLFCRSCFFAIRSTVVRLSV